MADYPPEKVTVALTTFNRWKFTKRTLENLYLHTDPKVEIIIMDNGSTDGSVEKIKKFIANQKVKLNIKLVDNKKNLGIGRAVNVAFEKGSGDLLIKLDNDILVQPDWVCYLWKIYKHFGDKFATCCLEVRDAGEKPLLPKTKTKGKLEKTPENIIFEHTPAVNGAAMALSRKFWSQNKFFEDRIYGHEDARLAVWAFRKGFVCGQLRSPNTWVIHLQNKQMYRQYDLWKLNTLHGKPYDFKKDSYCIPQEKGKIIEVERNPKK